VDELRQQNPYGLSRPQSRDSLVDVLDRVLDKGVVIAGDIAINLLDIELLTIKVRLLIASVDKAKEMGIDWWQHDPQLSSRNGKSGNGDHMMDDLRAQNDQLRARLEKLESHLGALPSPASQKASTKQKAGRSRRK